MTGNVPTAPTTRGDRVGLIGAMLALVGIVILLFTFRGLVFVMLPLALAAFVLGVAGVITASRPAHRLAAVAALVVGLFLLLVAVAALVADLNVSDAYDVYTRKG